MTAFQRSIICFGLVTSFIWFFRWHTPDLTVVYPDNCVFAIDSLFSKSMQFEIKDFIDQAYKKSKNPSNLLPKIEAHFSAVKSVVIDMHNPEALNFSIQAYKPLFLINNEHVVCQFGSMFGTSVFAQHELSKLHNITFEGVPTPKNVDYLVKFFQLLTDVPNDVSISLAREAGARSKAGERSDSILSDFSIRWVDKHAIWLDQKEGEKLSLLVGYDHVPTCHDIAQCRKLRGQVSEKPCKDKRGKSCKKNATWVCDLRFDQQVVLFSTNKGV